MVGKIIRTETKEDVERSIKIIEDAIEEAKSLL